VIYMNRRLGGDASLNATIREDGSGEWQDWLVDESPDQETTLAASEEFDTRRKTLSDTLTVLNERERRIFETRRLAEEQITASLRAAEIAETAEFFSFGTNDLTQTAFGISRDDAASFLGTYMARGILASDPFVSIDREGVGELVRIDVERGRKTKAKLKVGICGEHGGDPASVAFCHEIALDYVSCSPFRVPIARLAAAQAALGKGPAGEA
jgi:pyruvate,orthophosphate dikinase